MKAAVLYGQEDVRVEDIEIPRPGPGDVLLRTRVALTCGTDAKVFRRGYHARMIVPPAVFGHEVAGVVEEVGAGVEGLEPGTAVVAANSAPCGDCYYCRHEMPSLCDDLLFWNGAYAEFARIPARVVKKNLLPLEQGLEFREAAMVEPLACVIRGVEESWIGRGQSVAVIGTGPIGLMFVALARMRGAHVVAAGRRRQRLDKALEMGAEARGGRRARATTWRSCCAQRSPDGRGPGRRHRGRGPARDVGGRRAGGAEGRGRPALRRLPGGHPDRDRLPAPPLPGADHQVDVPPHAGERAQGLPAHRRRPHRRRAPSSPRRRRWRSCRGCWATWPGAATA